MTHNLPLQKDLEILREEVNRPTGRFEYMLFHKNQHVATRKHNPISVSDHKSELLVSLRRGNDHGRCGKVDVMLLQLIYQA